LGKSGIIIRKSKQLLYKSLDLSAVAFSFAFMFFAAQKTMIIPFATVDCSCKTFA
jgi:hypothetical protein